MKTNKEINQMLKDRYVLHEGIKDDAENVMYEKDTKKNSKRYRDAKKEYNEYFVRGCEVIRIYAEINDISFVDAMHILNNYKKSRRVAQ